MYVSVSVYHVCMGTCGGQKTVSDPLELKLPAIVSCPIAWELNRDPMKEQQVLLIDEPSPQSPILSVFAHEYICLP